MTHHHHPDAAHPDAGHRAPSRREMLRTLAGAGLVAAWPASARAAAQTDAAGGRPGRILVVVELTGANDGLNTLVPYTDDAYYRLRPQIALPARRVRRIDERFGFNPGMAGFERLYKDGHMAIVHGCGYAQPSFSHFTSAAYWHTGVPNGGEPHGWLGRVADAIDPGLTPNFIVNIDERQSLAVRARRHVPVVFNDPDRFARKGLHASRPLLDGALAPVAGQGATARYLDDVARSAREASAQVRAAWEAYRTPVDYGIISMDLPKVASMISAGMPTRLYHVAYRHNAFDTHVQQTDLHQRLLTYVSDAVSGFVKDLQRIGRADDVAVLVYSEFGRRPAENTSLGTDHGTANHMYVVGTRVKGGHFGEVPSLTQLDETGNQRHTTDFRRVYASLIEGWLGYADSASLLYGKYETLPLSG